MAEDKPSRKKYAIIALAAAAACILLYVNQSQPQGNYEGGHMGDVLTVDIYGNEVGNEIFTDHLMTMVYVWGTF